MKLITLGLLSLVVSHLTLAQENLIAGYVLDLKGDTVKGWIDYRHWAGTPKKIAFKRNLDGQVITFDPLSIKGFGVEGDYFEGGVVEVEVSPFTSKTLDFNSKFVLIKDTVFLQTLLAGTKNLYLYKDDVGAPMYYIKRQGNFELLLFKSYLQERNGTKEEFRNNTFQTQLGEYLSDCPRIVGKIKNTRYLRESLLKLFKEYHECKKAEVDFVRKEKIVVNFGALLGATYTKVSFVSLNPTFKDRHDYLARGNFDPSLNVSGGASLDIVFPQNLGRWSWYNELLFTSFKTSGYYRNYRSPNDYVISESNIGFSYLKANLMIRYNNRSARGIFFMNMGVSNGIPIVVTNELKRETKYYSDPKFETGLAVEDLRIMETGLMFGIGGGKGRLTAEGRFEYSAGFSGFYDLGTPVSRFYVLLGIRLNSEK